MRILLHTRFYPNVGGIETVAWILAHEWHRLGQTVTVVSDVLCPGHQRRELPFAVHYQPSVLKWLHLVREADVFAHMNISLKALWPLLLVPRPFVAVHGAYYYSDAAGNRKWRERLKLALTKKAVNIAPSNSVARHIPAPCIVIPNPADLALFQNGRLAARDRDIVFLGRLVSDKGCDLLLQALARLAERGLSPTLTVIGHGPEREKLDRLATSLNLKEQVTFVGELIFDKVADLLQHHQIMVVPSTYEEPFGVVALEGAASGCVVLGSDGGGLPEAIGPAGLTFRRNDATDLTDKLAYLLTHPQQWARYREAAEGHLETHQPTHVARRYLEVFSQAVTTRHARAYSSAT